MRKTNSSFLNDNIDVSDSSTESSASTIHEPEYQLHSGIQLQSLYNDPYLVRCLGEITISSDSLYTNLWYIFPKLPDPELEKRLYEDEESEEPLCNGDIDHYRFLCKKYRTPEIIKFEAMLDKDFVDLKYFALTTKALRAILETISYNENIVGCDFTSIYISVTGMEYLSDTLSRNLRITCLILEECSLTEKESEGLADGIMCAESLKVLNLNRNHLSSGGFKNLKKALTNNYSLEELYLSHNKIGSNVGEELQIILASMPNIKRLDLSWNCLHELRVIRNIVKGLLRNSESKLEYLNMAWNGLCGKHIGICFQALLKLYPTLKILDLSHNIIKTDFLDCLLDGLNNENCNLEELHLSGNQLKENDITNLLQYMSSTFKEYPLRKLDIVRENISRRHLPIKQILEHENREVICAPKVIGVPEITEPDYQALLLNRCKFLYENVKKKKKKAPPPVFGIFFWAIDSESDPIDNKAFMRFITSMQCEKITHDQQLLTELYKAFSNHEKRFMIGVMRDKYLHMYPDTPKASLQKIEEEKENKSGKKRKGKSKGKDQTQNDAKKKKSGKKSGKKSVKKEKSAKKK